MASSLKDVARYAGVSIKTVSNVVNGYVHVSAVTRAKVQQAIAALNYRPNTAARHLRQGRSGVIALALPELRAPYFAELAGFVVEAADERSLKVLIEQTDGARDRELEITEGVPGHLIDGLILSPLALTEDDLEQRTDRLPMILLGEQITDGAADRVVVDNVAAAEEAVAHLVSLGRRRIAAIGAQDAAPGATARLRLRGYRQALRRAGIAYDPSLVIPVEQFHRHDGALAMQGLLDLAQPPDAVFCFNDLLGLGALRTLLSHGLSVPGDVAVVGFDDIEESQYSTPTLTTVAPDKEEIARTAIDLLIKRFSGDHDALPRSVNPTYRLICRESTLGG
ncbi:DNA-binding LacI/PurR family transcriptional regulator [Saccharothrix tamanrassetensis]|uniref:DNA-binding LacI/PurR family transcriptional regulator n=1 Tax=Saccharothrix tamanrassetensis TaxID=1051531 RepID=A0A841CR87_9PSEU|nr:LacI family DNA-binding transcriptional regulator [Saccharothrix tamanrassetensis]MBB5959750.1 DNA-binding LacI/PurR family transcriptional regulator [Saccharothrix tamanrassetensis]